jgi:uncharacterized protein YneF (UPF0154 family)
MLNKNNDEVVNQIYTTTDYKKFKGVSGNRIVDEVKVRRLMKSMQKDGWLSTMMVIVNESMQIIDGQHKYLAARATKTPILYVIVNGTGLREVIKSNQGASNWKIKDHIPSQIALGNKSFILLDKLMREFPELTISICQMMLTQSTKNPSREDVENGMWKIGDYNLAVLWSQNLVSLKPYFKKGYKNTIFVRAMIDLLNKPNFNFQEFHHKVTLRPTMLQRCGTIKQYIEMVEEIYNYKRADKVNLRF